MGYYFDSFSGIILSFRCRRASVLAGFENPLLERFYHEHSPFALCGRDADKGPSQDEAGRERDARNKDQRS